VGKDDLAQRPTGSKWQLVNQRVPVPHIEQVDGLSTLSTIDVYYEIALAAEAEQKTVWVCN
jgi:hypothetical protein